MNESLVLARALIMIAHVAEVTSLLTASWNNEKRSYIWEIWCNDDKLMHAAYVIILLIIVECISIASRVIRLSTTSGWTSVIAHAAGTVTLFHFIVDQWYCEWFWFIFAICSGLPVLTDIFILFKSHVQNRPCITSCDGLY